MNTVVWIMVTLGYGYSINTGPEFHTKEKCERAATVITQTVNDRLTLGSVRPALWCVRIEK